MKVVKSRKSALSMLSVAMTWPGTVKAETLESCHAWRGGRREAEVPKRSALFGFPHYEYHCYRIESLGRNVSRL